MKNTWRLFFRRLAATCAISGAAAWCSAMCYAVQLAHDDGSDPVYADGWQASDNGGFGFEPWSFTTDASSEGLNIHRMDGVPPAAPTSFNAVGTAWTLGNTTFHTPPPSGDVARAGRGFSPLQVGQTIKVIIDNPTRRAFYRGYFVQFNGRNGLTGDGNDCYGNAPCTPGTNPSRKLNVRAFEYFSYGQWGVENGAGTPPNNFHQINLFDTDTAAAGAEIDVTPNANDTYTLTFTPLGNPAAAYTETGPLADQGHPIDWLEFTFFNTNATPGVDSEFFIRSIEIVGAAPPGVPGDYNNDGVVNAADYAIWRKNLGTNFHLPNEVSGVTPGSVTQEDYTAWRARFGNTSGLGSASVLSAIPEPGAIGFALSAITSFLAAGLRPLRRLNPWRAMAK